MSLRPRVGVVLLVLALVTFATATQGFTTITGARNADVVVAADTTAYLGIEPRDPVLVPGRHRDVVLLTLTNGFPESLTNVTVHVHDSTNRTPNVLAVVAPSNIAPGESATVTATVVCDARSVEQWTVTIAASGTSSSVTTIREVTVGCHTPSRAGQTTDNSTESGTETDAEAGTETDAEA